MRIGLRLILAAGVALALLPSSSRAADQPAASFKDDKEKASYGIGMYFGNQIKRSRMEIDPDVVIAAMKEVLAGKETKLTDQQAQEAIRAYQQAEQKKVAEKNKQEGTAFLAENKKKPGVKTIEVKLAEGTAEMQYKVITEGTGEIPKSNDVVSVNYKGTFINGKEFDSTAKRGMPMKRAANQLIRGWTEALERMKVGSKWEIYLPSSLAYGDVGNPSIDPGSTLIFEMELLGTEAAPPPPTAQPLTSDIIKVPSAEELKKGAKIEVIKPEDAARMAQEAQKTNSSAKK
jgi:FKBP-type peptidyl-prolyl cis-trans isomerase